MIHCGEVDLWHILPEKSTFCKKVHLIYLVPVEEYWYLQIKARESFLLQSLCCSLNCLFFVRNSIFLGFSETVLDGNVSKLKIKFTRFLHWNHNCKNLLKSIFQTALVFLPPNHVKEN